MPTARARAVQCGPLTSHGSVVPKKKNLDAVERDAEHADRLGDADGTGLFAQAPPSTTTSPHT
ncbi:MAG: hypothetical protein M3P40_05935 [Actinomycetota bacterium]|nr:hypothetical protein [Actinomycetota bacterium]